VVIAAKAESRNREIRKALLKTSNEEKQRIIQSSLNNKKIYCGSPNFLTPHDADLHALSLCSKALLVAVSAQARDIRFKRVARDRSAVHVIERCVARFPRLERLELQDSKLNKLPGAVATLNRLKILVAGKIYDPTIATS
tara:strand:- start:192 stop:611 length:420 start_codon:yes stop_codon:yes gene_type:complete